MQEKLSTVIFRKKGSESSTMRRFSSESQWSHNSIQLLFQASFISRSTSGKIFIRVCLAFFTWSTIQCFRYCACSPFLEQTNPVFASEPYFVYVCQLAALRNQPSRSCSAEAFTYSIKEILFFLFSCGHFRQECQLKKVDCHGIFEISVLYSK